MNYRPIGLQDLQNTSVANPYLIRCIAGIDAKQLIKTDHRSENTLYSKNLRRDFL